MFLYLALKGSRRPQFRTRGTFVIKVYDILSVIILTALLKRTSLILLYNLQYSRAMSSGAGSSGTGRGRGSSLADNKPESKEAKPNPKMSKALGTSAKR